MRDSTASNVRKTGLTPTWVFLTKTSDWTTAATQPTITELSNGQYRFSYDAAANGEAAGQIDAGSALTNAGDRYIDVFLTT